jgi:hypothetical protein
MFQEHISSIRTKIILSNQILNNRVNRTTENEQKAERIRKNRSPGALLKVSYFIADLQYTIFIFYNIILGLGEDDIKLGSIPGDTILD